MPIQKWSERIWVVKLADEPLLSEEMLGVMAEAKMSSNMPDLVLDMSSVNRFNSSNLSQLLRIRKMSIDREARLRLASVPDGLWAVFISTGLDQVFHFDRDVPNSLAGLQLGRG